MRRRDCRDFPRIQMDAMPEHGFRRQQSALLINMSIIARADTHIKVMNFFNLLAIFREMSLQVSIEPGGQFRRAAHQFFRTGNRKAWTESIFESAFFGPVPFATKPFALQQRNREYFFRLELAIRPEVHHRFAQDNAQSALLGGFEPDFATVFENRRIDHSGGGAVAGKFVEKLRRLGPRLWSGELVFDGKNVLAQPRKQFALASGNGGILRQMRMAIDEAGENRHRPPLDPANQFGPLPPAKIIIIARCGDSSVFDNDGPISPAAQVAKFRRIDQESANAKQVTVLFHSAPPMKHHTAGRLATLQFPLR